MKAWGSFLSVLDDMPEGDGTLLDHMLVVAHSETEFARAHNINNLPIMFAGQAGGRIRSGLNIVGKGSPVSSVALTAMQVMGVGIDSFGTGAMQTSRTIGDILV